MNPQTTEGIAASSSMTILRVSLSLGPQNSDTKTAAASPAGTAITMASSVTEAVPAIRARIPN